MAYATADDLERYWRTLSESEETQASALLDVASLFLDEYVDKYDIDTTAKADALTYVCCELVRRKMESATAVPYSSITQTAGSFSETISYGGSRRQSWELYPEDEKLLGIKHPKFDTVPVAIHPTYTPLEAFQ